MQNINENLESDLSDLENYEVETEDDDYKSFVEQMDRYEHAKNIIRNRTDAGLKNIMQYLLADSKENNVVSPLTLYFALLLLGKFTIGNTQEQILNALKLKNADLVEISQALNDYIEDKIQKSCNVSQSVWFNEKLVNQELDFEMLANLLQADVKKIAMGENCANVAMKNWLNEKTGGTLDSYIQNIKCSKEDGLKLLSVLFFYDTWWHKYEKEYTKKRKFWISQTEYDYANFMKKILTGQIYEYDNFTAVNDYLSSGYTMKYILPKSDVDAEKLLSNNEVLNFIVGDACEDRLGELCFINIQVPRFDVTCNLNLIETLKMLGIEDVLDARKAEFKEDIINITNLVLTEANQTTRLKIDEDGVEGGSIVEFGIACAGLPPKLKNIQFILDRPFLFAIVKGDNLPIFYGIIRNPGLVDCRTQC